MRAGALSLGLMAFGATVLAGAGKAEAHIDELYLGVFEHNACMLDCKNAYKEGEPNIEAELDFSPSHALHVIGSPRPFLIASINTQGDTSYGGFGLNWKFKLGDHWSIDPGFGYVLHNGELKDPYPNGTPESAHFTDEHVLLGSRDLFHTTLALTRDLPGPWEIQAAYQHLSHGQILGHGRNQGLDEFGVRLGYKFGE